MPSKEYLEAFLEKAKELLPNWMWKQIYNEALPKSGGTAKAKKLKEKLDKREIIVKPEPQADEDRQDFIDRFMGDEKAVDDFPDEEQRLAVAVSMWEQHQDNPVNKQGEIFSAWRCEICNYVYLGFNQADRCPHCGADGVYLVDPVDYVHHEQVEVADITQTNLQRALELEAECESLYRAMEEVAENRISESYFRRLARHESHHKQELAEMMGVDEPDLFDVEVADNDFDNFQMAYEAELIVIDHYQRSIEEADNERAINVFRSFLEVEERHRDTTHYFTEVDEIEQVQNQQPTSSQVSVDSPDWEEEGRILKRNDEKQLVYGIVLEPETVDAQGDIMARDEIENTAHIYLKRSRIVGNNHLMKADASVVQSYIAPTNFSLNGEQVIKGSWVLVVKIEDGELWKQVKAGQYNAFSIGGYGKRE